MKQGVMYAVFVSQKEDSVGHFLDGKYYEPFGSNKQLGHLDPQNNFVYYIVTPEDPDIKIYGKLEINTLARLEDNSIFRVEIA